METESNGELDAPLDGESVAESLLRFNYFPRHAADHSEMPPSVHSEQLELPLLDLLADGHIGGDKRFEVVEYGLTRFDLSIRSTGIPHPVAYAGLVRCIKDNWQHMNGIADNSRSMIRPLMRADGRIFSMNYSTPPKQEFSTDATERFGRRFVVKTDIKNFFPSIYTHALPWALVTKEVAKRNTSSEKWYNELDRSFRRCQRGQTNGLPVGPGTSTVGAEILLKPIDEALVESGFSDFHRFIDDYTFFADTYDSGQKFIDELSLLLRQYELQINGAKTSIEMLPLPSRPAWLSQVVMLRPKEIGTRNELQAYLDLAVDLSAREPSGNVLKYAIKSLDPQTCDDETKSVLARLILNLSFHRPGLMPLLDSVLDYPKEASSVYSDELNRLVQDAARFGRSDAAAWAIHILIRSGSPVDSRTVEELLKRSEIVPLSMLHATESLTKAQITAALAIAKDARSGTAGSAAWLLEYVLGQSKHYKHQSEVMAELDNAGVNFIERDLSGKFAFARATTGEGE